MGPPGSKRKEHVLTLGDNIEDFKYDHLWVGDVLSKEITKKSDIGLKIREARRTYSYPDDDIVIDLITKQIEQLENKENKRNWVIEGFPRTRRQALALSKMDFIPDCMILLDVNDELTKERVRRNLTSEEATVQVDEAKIPEIIEQAVEEYHTHIEGVKDIYKGMISTIDGNQKKDTVLQEISRTIKLEVTNTPKRVPKIILFGIPGSGKTTQAIMIAEKLKVIHIQVRSLLKDQAPDYWELVRDGNPIPDQTIQDIVRNRLEQIDVKINGFVLDGFPLNSDQMAFLINECNIKPTQLIFLEISDHKAYERLEDHMFDPESGVSYSISTNLPQDEKIIKRLVKSPENEHHVVKKSIQRHKDFKTDIQKRVVAEQLTHINAENGPEQVFNDICSEIII